jgi:hypothetical protein
VRWPAGLNLLHNPGVEWLTDAKSARAGVSPSDPLSFWAPWAGANTLRNRAGALPNSQPATPAGRAGQPSHKRNAPEPRASGSIKRDDAGARGQRGCPLAVFAASSVQAACPVRKPAEATHPPSATTTFRRRDPRAVPHIDVEICTVVAVLHVWQRGRVAAQAIRPITGAGLVTHFEAFWVRDEN